MGLKELETVLKCSHVKDDQPWTVYRTFQVGNLWLWLCKACWGEVVVEVKDWFSETNVNIKAK